MTNQLQGLIFDVDGTLANTERDGHRVAFNQAFTDAGLDWNWSIEFYGQLLAIPGGKERIRFYLGQYLPDFKPSQDMADFVADLHQLKTKYYLALLRKGAVKLRPGVKRLIDEARTNNIRLAIATTSSLSNVIALLERYLDLNCFEAIAAGDIVAQKKPAADIYNYVLDQISISTQNLLAFEDSDNGLTAATEAGLRTVITVNSYTEKQDFSLAALVVSDLGEPGFPCKVIQGNILNKYLDNKYLDLASLQLINNQKITNQITNQETK